MVDSSLQSTPAHTGQRDLKCTLANAFTGKHGTNPNVVCGLAHLCLRRAGVETQVKRGRMLQGRPRAKKAARMPRPSRWPTGWAGGSTCEVRHTDDWMLLLLVWIATCEPNCEMRAISVREACSLSCTAAREIAQMMQYDWDRVVRCEHRLAYTPTNVTHKRKRKAYARDQWLCRARHAGAQVSTRYGPCHLHVTETYPNAEFDERITMVRAAMGMLRNTPATSKTPNWGPRWPRNCSALTRAATCTNRWRTKVRGAVGQTRNAALTSTSDMLSYVHKHAHIRIHTRRRHVVIFAHSHVQTTFVRTQEPVDHRTGSYFLRPPF